MRRSAPRWRRSAGPCGTAAGSRSRRDIPRPRLGSSGLSATPATSPSPTVVYFACPTGPPSDTSFKLRSNQPSSYQTTRHGDPRDPAGTSVVESPGSTGELIDRLAELFTERRAAGVSGVLDDDKTRVRPVLHEIPDRTDQAAQILTALNDDAGDARQPSRVADQGTVLQPRVVAEDVGAQPDEGDLGVVGTVDERRAVGLQG